MCALCRCRARDVPHTARLGGAPDEPSGGRYRKRPATDLRISAQAAPTCVTLATECSGPVLLKLWRKLGIATGRAEHTAMTCWSFASG